MPDAGPSDSSRSSQRWPLAMAIWLLAAFAIIVGLRGWLPEQASAHSSAIDLMLNYLLVTIGAVLVVGHVVLGYFIVRFGAQSRPSFRLPAKKQERRWAVIPIILMAVIAEGGVIVLGLPVWAEYIASGPPADAVRVEVTGEQFGWNIRYPGKDGVFGRYDPHLITLDNALGLDPEDPPGQDDIVILGEMTLPVGKPIHIILRTKDTQHAFFLPHQRVKQDAVPGMTIDFWFIPTEIGTFEVACAELCGLGHYSMRAVMHVVEADEFQKWADEQVPLMTYF